MAEAQGVSPKQIETRAGLLPDLATARFTARDGIGAALVDAAPERERAAAAGDLIERDGSVRVTPLIDPRHPRPATAGLDGELILAQLLVAGDHLGEHRGAHRDRRHDAQQVRYRAVAVDTVDLSRDGLKGGVFKNAPGAIPLSPAEQDGHRVGDRGPPRPEAAVG